LVVRPHLAFRHPLIRSAVYHSAPAAERRRAHEALAEEIDAESDPDRRAWHQAEAALGRDEDVALELERAAVRAKGRGGCAAAASFLARAAELSVEPSQRAARLLGAAEEELAAGAPDRARPLLDEALPSLASARDTARAMAVKGELLYLSRTPARAAATLLEAAHRFEAFDAQGARGLLLDAMEAAVSAGEFAEGANVVDVARAALDMPLPPGAAPSADDLLLDGHAALYTGDFAAAAPRLKAALAVLRADPATWSLRNLAFACWAALAPAIRDTSRASGGARSGARPGAAPVPRGAAIPSGSRSLPSACVHLLPDHDRTTRSLSARGPGSPELAEAG
jgi:hypothetical protein